MIEHFFIRQPPFYCEWRVPVDGTVYQSDFFFSHLFTIILIIVREYLSKTFLDHIQIKIPTA